MKRVTKRYPLTLSSFRAYLCRNAETTAGGFGDPVINGGRPPRAVFLRPSHGKPNGRTVRGRPSGLPAPLTGSPTCARFRPPVWRRESGKTNRYQWSIAMSLIAHRSVTPATPHPALVTPKIFEASQHNSSASLCWTAPSATNSLKHVGTPADANRLFISKLALADLVADETDLSADQRLYIDRAI